MSDSSIHNVLGEFAIFFSQTSVLEEGSRKAEEHGHESWSRGGGSGCSMRAFSASLTHGSFSRNGNDSKTGTDS